MTNSHSPDETAAPDSMVEADTANGEAPDTDLQGDTDPVDDTTRPGLDDRPVDHATGVRQAQQNLENDPPA